MLIGAAPFILFGLLMENSSTDPLGDVFNSSGNSSSIIFIPFARKRLLVMDSIW